jgi:hypothetical protein
MFGMVFPSHRTSFVEDDMSNIHSCFFENRGLRGAYCAKGTECICQSISLCIRQRRSKRASPWDIPRLSTRRACLTSRKLLVNKTRFVASMPSCWAYTKRNCLRNSEIQLFKYIIKATPSPPLENAEVRHTTEMHLPWVGSVRFWDSHSAYRVITFLMAYPCASRCS